MASKIIVQGYIITYLEGTKYQLNIVWEQGKDAMSVSTVHDTLEDVLKHYEAMKADPSKLPR